MSRTAVTIAAVALVAAACSPASDASPDTPTATSAPPVDEDAAVSSSASGTSSTTSTIPASIVPLLAEPPPFEEITLTTPDGVDLHAKLWKGGPVAIIAGHDFDNRQAGSQGEVPPQSSESLLWWTGVLADAGYTVLSPDYRGHGQSGGEPNVRDSQIDIKTAYEYLTEAGYETIVMAGLVGSGTSAVVLDASDDDVAFDGIAMLWSPPQDTGLDASRVLSEIEAPIFIVGIDYARSARWTKLMSREVRNLYNAFIFPQVPSGVQFIDVFGEEFAGRLLDFVSYVEETS